MHKASTDQEVRSWGNGDGRKETFGYSDAQMFRKESRDRRRETEDGRKASVRRGAFALGPSDAGKVSFLLKPLRG
ncbi:hypothetical protein [uncultured Imperialibacter sp.]|uniref:hypothetical protein n=1 Tax=uncultured Imperialibacter sp. TaxID=1672639 RepID=UPI0030D99B2E|tara:strand:- start:2347 stop:2571 length:225 start_codon:yes stop_codon:yes gene_type:complete